MAINYKNYKKIFYQLEKKKSYHKFFFLNKIHFIKLFLIIIIKIEIIIKIKITLAYAISYKIIYK